MTNTTPTPRQREIVSTAHVIRAHWSRAKRSERRRLAKTKQLQLLRWVAAGPDSGQHAV
jgi:hypothetical protein